MKIEWEFVDKQPSCGTKRAPEGVVSCERQPGHPGEHMARGKRGQWFGWGDRPTGANDNG